MNINIPVKGRDLPNDNVYSAQSHTSVSRTTKTASDIVVDISGKDKDIKGFGMEELKSFDDMKAKAQTKNVSLESDALVVMSHSMSGEDFANITKDGFSPADMTPEETVTTLDKIKATLVKAGVSVPGYTDDLSPEKIEAIAGSVSYANAIQNALTENQLPANRENVEEITEVLNLAASTTEPSADAKKYIISNELDLTVNNFYVANHSSSDANAGNKAGFYKDATGYIGKNPTQLNIDELMPQIEKIISESGLEVNDKTLNDAKWLIEKNVPLTEDNLKKLQDINSISFPLDTEVVAKSTAAAIADGKEATSAVVTETESIVTRAGKFVNDLTKKVDNASKNLDNGKPAEAFKLTGTDNEISARRMLEETRLALTVEASTALLKKGIEIDTTDLQNLVEELKTAEKEAYAPFLMEEKFEDVPADKVKAYDDELTLKLGLFKQTTKAIDDIKDAPLEVVGEIATNAQLTLEEVAKSAVSIKADYDKANKSYETMMTAPRFDLGDSIKKAFRNVDDILEDLDMEVTRLNEKAVRILGYSGQEINEKNIEAATKSEVALENVISHMTPARVLKMIKDGENPLEKDIFELSNELMDEGEEIESAKYSEFLYKLEKSNQITEPEKKAFIGVYRLLKKIEKSDGKLLGNVMKADEKLTLSNLLQASRSNKQLGTDVKIDDSFGALEKLITHGESITDQILNGFRREDIDKEYAAAEAKDIKEMISKEEAVLKTLENIEEPHSPINMAAVDMLINSRGSLFKGLKDKLDDDEKEEFDDEMTNLQDSFEDEDAVKNAYETFAKKTEEIIKNKAQIADNYIDVKSLKLMNKQLSMTVKMADSRTYEVPVEINGELTSINLKLINDAENAGKVRAFFETSETGKVSAEFDLKNGEVTGTIVTENSYFEGELRKREDTFKNEFSGVGVNVSSMYYTSSRGVSVKGNYTEKEGLNTPETKELYLVAKAIIKAVQK